MNPFTPFFRWFATIVLGATAVIAAAGLARSAEPTTDLPKEQPATATGFFCQNGSGRRSVLAVIFTYPSGKVVRVDIEHMHGLANAADLTKYASSAPDQSVYIVACLDPSFT